MIDIGPWERTVRRLPRIVAEAELNVEHRTLGMANFMDGHPAGGTRSESVALYLRVSGEKTGYLYTQDPTEDPAAAILRAYDNGLISDHPLPDEMRRGSDAFAGDYGMIAADTDPAWLLGILSDLDAGIRSLFPFRARLSLSLKAETVGMRTVNSHGLDTVFERPLYVLNAAVSTERNGRRYGTVYNETASSPERFSSARFASSLEDQLRCQFDPAPFRPGIWPSVLGKTVVYNILSTAWQVFSGKRCAEGSSMLSGIGRGPVAATCLSIRDYPSRPDSGFDFPCDCEGSPGHPVDLLVDGIFTGLMHNLGSARAFGEEPTGNAGRRPLLSGSVPTEILVTPRNIRVEPGSSPPERLVARMAEGVFVTGSFDVFHSIDIASGAFSIPCRGMVVKSGRPCSATGPVVVSGNLRDLARGVVEVGDDEYFGTMLALDSYGIGACSLRVDHLSFSGA